MSKTFHDLISTALDDALGDLADKELGPPIIPSVFELRSGSIRTVRFATMGMVSYPEARQAALDSARASPVEVDCVAVSYDADATIDGSHMSVAVVHAHQRGKPRGLRVIQPYRPRRLFRTFKLIGDPIVEEDDALLSRQEDGS